MRKTGLILQGALLATVFTANCIIRSLIMHKLDGIIKLRSKGWLLGAYEVRRGVAMLCYELIYIQKLGTFHKDDESFV